ncbi:hypothetical protein BDV19DRAFT_387558 [Aspergillus venezuelensis]
MLTPKQAFPVSTPFQEVEIEGGTVLLAEPPKQSTIESKSSWTSKEMSAPQPQKQPTPTQPIILSMEVDSSNQDRSHYRRHAFASYPVPEKPFLGRGMDNWVHFARQQKRRSEVFLFNDPLWEVENQWHHTLIDFLDLERT